MKILFNRLERHEPWGGGSSFVNAIRRTAITGVDTISFSTEEYINSDLQVIANTSSLHNEFILHRMGMLPINVKNVDEFNTDNYKFILKKSNETQNIINVTTKDIVILNLETNETEDNELFFPRNSITGDHILIIKLKPNPNGEGQAIHIEGKSSKNSGKKHIRYSPVSNVLFTNKKDTELINIEFSKYVSGLQEEKSIKFNETEIKELANVFNIESSEQYFYTDDNNDPNRFDFVIESVGILEPHRILILSMTNISDRLK